MKKILATLNLPEECTKIYKNEFEFVQPDYTKLAFSRDEIIKKVGDCEGLFTVFNREHRIFKAYEIQGSPTLKSAVLSPDLLLG